MLRVGNARFSLYLNHFIFLFKTEILNRTWYMVSWRQLGTRYGLPGAEGALLKIFRRAVQSRLMEWVPRTVHVKNIRYVWAGLFRA